MTGEFKLTAIALYTAIGFFGTSLYTLSCSTELHTCSYRHKILWDFTSYTIMCKSAAGETDAHAFTMMMMTSKSSIRDVMDAPSDSASGSQTMLG